MGTDNDKPTMIKTTVIYLPTRKKRGGCEVCKDALMEAINWCDKEYNIHTAKVKYCPVCGKRINK